MRMLIMEVVRRRIVCCSCVLLIASSLLSTVTAVESLSTSRTVATTTTTTATKPRSSSTSPSTRKKSRILQQNENDNSSFEYEASTDVSFFLNLALDAADMRAADDDATSKVDIYYNGRHAFVEDDDGNKTNISFAGLSLGSIVVMSGDPLYNVYRHAFYQLGVDKEEDQEGNFDGHPVEEYGNTLVMDLFELNSTRSETVGALVINVWMAIAHEFANLERGCRSFTTEDDSVKMNRALDRAAALWIGADQVRGDNIHGHLLYNLAEQAGELFDQDNGETWVNAQLMDMINSIQQDIQNEICSQDGGYLQMRIKIRQAITYMTIPLVQMLIHHIIQVRSEGGSDLVELYALALLPRVAACDPNTYQDMLGLMVFESLQPEDSMVALDLVHRVFSCWDIRCQAVGTYLHSAAYQCQDTPLSPPDLAGYTPMTDVRAKSYIDRDMLQMQILMFYTAYDAAADLYQYGSNSDYSLYQLATNKVSPYTSQQFDLFNSYYNTNLFEFADNIIINVLNSAPPFDNASEAQRTAIIMDLLQSVVGYLSVVSELEAAITKCQQGGTTDVASLLQLWDGGAAFFIGSIEGNMPAGQPGGQMLYGASKQFCSSFGTCEPDDAAVNEVMLQALAFGRDALSGGECEEAETVLRTSIQPALYIPLIQGTLLNAELCENVSADSTEPCVGSLFAYSRSLLPSLNQAFPQSAASLSASTSFQLTAPPVQGGLPALFENFRLTLPHIATDCRDLGSLGRYGGLCPDDQPVSSAANTPGVIPTSANSMGTNPSDSLYTIPHPHLDNEPAPISAPKSPISAPIYSPATAGHQLAWGRYAFTDINVAEQDSKFALDIRDMRLGSDSNVDSARSIYENGQNALDGLFDNAEMATLHSLSAKASISMKEDPMYNFFRFALYDESTFEENQGETWPFADMVVKLALNPDNGNDAQLAAEAAVVMNVWMTITHRLYRAAAECKQQKNPTQLIDSAVALWLGREQGEGRYNSGWMMYSIIQQSEQLYGLDEREAKVNTDLMAAFNEAKVLCEYCSSQSNAFLEVRFLVNDIVKLLTKPLLQNLLFYISEDNLDYTELYALSLIPQAVSCKTSTYLALKAVLVDDFSRDNSLNFETYDNFGFFLNCLGMTCDDLGDTRSANPKLQEIVASICSKLHGDHESLAGYEPTTDVVEKARIDLDIRQIDIFMRTRSYEAAADLYLYGRNSNSSSRTLLSNRFLATTEERTLIGDPFQVYSSYFQSDNYADEIIMSALRREGDFANASRQQLAQVVLRTLQSMVSYMAVQWKLYEAVTVCREVDTGHEQEENMDSAVAFYVGFLEGPMFGGSPGGVTMYSLAKESCGAFGTCEGSGDAGVNEKLMSALSEMRDYLAARNCDSAASILQSRISTLMPVPLIQSSIFYAAENEELEPRADTGNLAAGQILSEAVLPLVKVANPSSASIIGDNMDFLLDSQPVPDGSSAVSGAFADALHAMGIDCDDVGSLQSKDLSVCSSTSGEPLPPRPDTPTNLGDDLYVTTTYVQDRADIALDMRSMERALLDGHKELAKLIYMEGENSNVYDQYGKTVSHRTLGGFSINSTLDMNHEPIFNIFVYALQDEDGLYLGKEARLYADSIVQEAFGVTSDSAKTLPAEAVVALNLWMFLAHKLFETLRNCKSRQMADTDGALAIDEAVAYWIGDGQIAGDSERGHLLYALAERMGEEFGIDQSGQSRTNTNILRLFHQAKMELSFPNACSDNPNTFPRLRHIVNNVVSQMTIPIIQGLIHNLRTNDANRVRIYAHSFVPLVAGCSPVTFEYLRDKLIRTTYNVVEVEQIIDQIRSTFPCFNLQCDDVGTHSTEIESSCEDPPNLNPLSGYRPASNVKEYAQLDLDILEIDILMQMQAYDAAEELYTYGKHTVTEKDSGLPAVSLAHLATAAGRSVVPEFDSFVRYYDGDSKYADTIIRAALVTGDQDAAEEGSSYYHLTKSYGPDERRLIVLRSCEFLVLFMAALQGFNESVGECEANAAVRDVSSAESWDRAAAFLIGHLEGSVLGGSEDGRLFFALAKKRCEEFGTCSNNEKGTYSVNDRIESLLYAGRGAVLGRSCSELRKATKELEPLLLVPMIQSVLSYVLRVGNKSAKTQGNGHSEQVEAFVYASALLPLIEDVDRGAAETLKGNLEVMGSPLKDGASVVVSALANVYSGLGVKCEYVGTTQGVDLCTGSGSRSSVLPTGLIIGVVSATLALVISIFLLWFKRNGSKKAENNPKFVASPNGVMNHTEDLLRKSSSSKHFDREVTKQFDSSSTYNSHDEAVAMISDDSDSEKSSEGDIV